MPIDAVYVDANTKSYCNIAVIIALSLPLHTDDTGLLLLCFAMILPIMLLMLLVLQLPAGETG